MLYLTSDLHLDHKFAYDIRGFWSADKMHEHMIEKWNSIVRQKDTVYIVGDVSLHVNDEVLRVLKAMNGTKMLVPGNHDHSGNLKKLAEVLTVLGRLEIIKKKSMKHLSEGTCDYNLALCHYPMMCWPGDMLAYGHLHGTTHHTDFASYYDDKPAVDVGWDVFGEPVAPDFCPSVIRDAMKVAVRTAVHDITHQEILDDAAKN